MASTPAYPAYPRTQSVQLSASETSRTSPTAASAFFTAGSAGSVCYRALIKATATTSSNGMIFIWLYDGSNYRIIQEIQVPAITPSATLPSFEDEVPFSDMILQSGWSLRASTYNANTFNVIGVGADF